MAEEVEKLNPDLVVRDKEGKPFSVRYEAVNAMLLNEFLKQHRKVEEQQATITSVNSTVENQNKLIKQLQSTAAKQEATIARQEREFRSRIVQQDKDIETLAATLKQQASAIQKVNDELKLSKPLPRIVAKNR